MKCLIPTSNGVLLKLKVQPRASKNQIVGLHGDYLRLRINAPPCENAANEALIEYLSEVLQCPKSRLSIVHGHKSSIKTLSITNMDLDHISSILESQISSK